MSGWKDKRKNIYTIVVTACDNGDVINVETHSNKKEAERRHEAQVDCWITRLKGGEFEGRYKVTLTTTKLQRRIRGFKY